MSKSNRQAPKKSKKPAKQWKAAPSKLSETTEIAKQIVELLKKYYPEAKCSLDYKNPFELLVATVLSAQCTDERVNKTTPDLFRWYPTPEKMSVASVEDLERIVRPTGFYKNKAKSLKGLSEILFKKHNSIVPQSLDELTHLPGVGVKTANVVLGTAFDIPSGVVVDTHVGRLSKRMGLSRGKTAEQIQFDLEKVIDKADWIGFSHRMIYHGRQTCTARRAYCEKCFLQDICPKIGV